MSKVDYKRHLASLLTCFPFESTITAAYCVNVVTELNFEELLANCSPAVSSLSPIYPCSMMFNGLTGCGRRRRLPDDELWLEAPAALCSDVAELDLELSPPDRSSVVSSLSPVER